MKPLFDAWLIQIEVTTLCRHACAHCTRGIRHFAHPSSADLAFVEAALKSLVGWRKGVGCTGGEPTLHPQFAEICQLYGKYFPRHQCGLWTNGGPNYEAHRSLIDRTFGIINYNDHQSPSIHHPIMVAAEEVIKDTALREELIDQCWMQLHWSPIITPRGAFFCEVAATHDALLGGPGGYPLNAGWWNRDVRGFAEQRDAYCRRCSIPIPFEALPDSLDADWVTPGNARDLRASGSPLASQGRLHVVDTVFTREDIGRMRSAQRRISKTYAQPDPDHFWVRTPIRAWFWKYAKYRHIPGGQFRFLADTARFLGFKVRDFLSRIWIRRGLDHERPRRQPGKTGS